MKTATRSVLVWFCFLVLAFINGAFRELVLIQYFKIDPHHANQVSCLTGVTLWTLCLFMSWKKLEVKRLRTAVWIGVGWFVATFLFETFILNRKLTWEEILHTYDVTSGEYWGLVILWVGLMPIAANRVGLKYCRGE